MAINVNPGDPHYPDGGQSLWEERAVKDQPSYRNRPKPMTNGVTIQQEQFQDVTKMVTNADRTSPSARIAVLSEIWMPTLARLLLAPTAERRWTVK